MALIKKAKYKKGEMIYRNSIAGRMLSHFMPQVLKETTSGAEVYELKRNVHIKFKSKKK